MSRVERSAGLSPAELKPQARRLRSVLRARLCALHSKNLLRRLRVVTPKPDRLLEFEGREVIDFASNDYLGLSHHPRLAEAAAAAIEEFGTGAGASRLISGTLPPHRALEEKIAAFKNVEAAIVFSSGYAAAVGALPAIASRGDVILLDKLAHASLIDGASLSGATLRVFPHNDLEALEERLVWAKKKHTEALRLIVTESIFSMDGDAAPLAQIIELKKKHGALLLLDEAHAIGLRGNHGEGLAAELDLAREVDLQMGTLSKALGSAGGYIAGSRELIDWLVNRARSFIFSTAPPPPAAAAAAAAIDLLQSEEAAALVEKLRGNRRIFHDLLKGANVSVSGKYAGAIFPVQIGDAKATLAASEKLFARGIYAPAIRYPSVPRGQSRLRLTLSAVHTQQQLERCACALEASAMSADS